MPETPKITFAEGQFKQSIVDGLIKQTVINGLALTVSPATSDILAAVHFGFAQAVEMFKVVTQPAPMPQQMTVQGFGDPGEDEETGTGTLNMASIWQMDPIAREAILARHGLQTYREAPSEPDVTAETMAQAIKDGGGIPSTEEF